MLHRNVVKLPSGGAKVELPPSGSFVPSVYRSDWKGRTAQAERDYAQFMRWINNETVRHTRRK